jgi:hypothetical protein
VVPHHRCGGGLVCAAELAMLVAAGFDLHHQDIAAPAIRKDGLHIPAKGAVSPLSEQRGHTSGGSVQQHVIRYL